MASEEMTGRELLSWYESMGKTEKATVKRISDEMDASRVGFLELWMFARTVMELRQQGRVIDIASFFSEAVLAGVNVIRDKHKLPNEYRPAAQRSKPVRGI
jgi:hypothetical protein